MRLAILADIHGNLPALEAVLIDLDKQSPDAVYVAGDIINRCPWNNEVLDILAERQWPAIYGNHEWVIARLGTPENVPPFTDRSYVPTLWWTWDQLAPHHLQMIRALPAALQLTFDDGPAIHMFHGQPSKPFLGIMPDMSDEQIAQLLLNIPEPVIVCAHTHFSMIRNVKRTVANTVTRTVNQDTVQAATRWMIVNGGSIGMPYNNDPRAQYVLLDSGLHNGQRRWQPTLRQVDYDRSGLPQAFIESGMIDEIGPSAELHLRTAMTGEPWSSDFGYWLRTQPASTKQDMTSAVAQYLQKHGPGHWAFLQ